MFLSPEKFIEYCDVHHGMKVADFGASIGSYSLPLAKRVGVNGKVYAFDIQKELLTTLFSDARKDKLENVEIVWTDLEIPGGAKLQDESVDRVLIANTLFQIEDKSSFISEAKRILKKGGKVIFIDWLGSFEGVGPHPKAVVTQVDAEKKFDEHRFKKERHFSPGEHHYGIIFIK